MSYKILFYDARSHEISFLEKYGTLYNLLENLVTNKIKIHKAYAVQRRFIINLMLGYNKIDLFGKETWETESISRIYKILNKANEILFNCKENLRRGIKSSFPKKFKKCFIKCNKSMQQQKYDQ